jgi:hypothetical protein
MSANALFELGLLRTACPDGHHEELRRYPTTPLYLVVLIALGSAWDILLLKELITGHRWGLLPILATNVMASLVLYKTVIDLRDRFLPLKEVCPICGKKVQFYKAFRDPSPYRPTEIEVWVTLLFVILQGLFFLGLHV